MNKLSFFALVPFLFCINCRKGPDNDINTPPQNYCTAYVNGKYWKAESTGMFDNFIRCEWDHQKRDFYIDCHNAYSQSITIDLYDSAGLKNGQYELNRDIQANCAHYRDYSKSFSSYYATGALTTGRINIIFDEARSRVSGTFSFKAKFDTDSEIVNVTNGSFSIPCQIDQ